MSIFNYSCYRKFITDTIKSQECGGRGQKSKLADFINVNQAFISQVVSGEKDFSLEQAIKVANFFNLKNIETDFFLNLLLIDRAGSQELKDYYQKKKTELKKESQKVSSRLDKNKKMNILEQSIFYSSKNYSLVHLYTSLAEGKSFEEIQNKFKFSKNATSEILNFLMETNLVYLEDNKYKISSKSTHIDKDSPYLSNHHKNWRLYSLSRLDNNTNEDLVYSANFTASKADIAVLKEKILKLIQDMTKTIVSSEDVSDEMAVINIDLLKY